MSQTLSAPPLDLCAQIQIELEASSSADGKPAAGALPRFRMVAYTGGPMKVAGWRHPVIVDLAGLAIPSQGRPIRFGHDAAHGVGHTDAIHVESGQLVAAGIVSRDTAAAREIVTSSKNGFPWQASIGCSVEEFEFVKEGQTVLVNGRSFQGPANVVRKATLGEISFVDLGADGNTSAAISGQQSTAQNTPNQENPIMPDSQNTQIVAAAGPTTTVAAATPAAATATIAAPDDPAAPAPAAAPSHPVPAPPPIVASAAPSATAAAIPAPAIMASGAAVEQIRAEALAETQRISAIRKLCAPAHSPVRFGDIEAKAIAEGWDAARTELEVLRASRPTTLAMTGAPAVIVRGGDGAVTAPVLEAACYMSARLEGLEKLFDEQTLEAADRRFRRAIGLQELILEAAWANGYTGRSFRDTRAVMQWAFPPVNAAFSTIDIGGILSNVANKFLLEGFFSVERTWRNICAVRNVSDFKAVTSYRLIGTDQYEQVSPGGELKHGNLGNETYTNKADTYGLLLAVDRRDIINDDLGAVTTVPRKLGRGSGLKINDVFWGTFLNNAAFFAAANKNYLTGADTTLSIDGLSKAEVAFMDQVDSDGKPIGIMPAIMLVPTALSAMATQLYKSLEIRDTTASTKYPLANPHQGKFRAEVSRYLSNAKYTGYSAKAWYLLADPADLPVVEVAFLNGQESPTIETAEADFNVLGIQMRGYHDFGCALQDARGGVKSKGEA